MDRSELSEPCTGDRAPNEPYAGSKVAGRQRKPVTSRSWIVVADLGAREKEAEAGKNQNESHLSPFHTDSEIPLADHVEGNSHMTKENGSETAFERIISWNVAGWTSTANLIRSQYHSIDEFLKLHDVDIFCIQETKLDYSTIQESTLARIAPADNWQTFWSYYSKKGDRRSKGYSGVSTFAKNGRVKAAHPEPLKMLGVSTHTGHHDICIRVMNGSASDMDIHKEAADSPPYLCSNIGMSPYSSGTTLIRDAWSSHHNSHLSVPAHLCMEGPEKMSKPQCENLTDKMRQRRPHRMPEHKLAPDMLDRLVSQRLVSILPHESGEVTIFWTKNKNNPSRPISKQSSSPTRSVENGKMPLLYGCELHAEGRILVTEHSDYFLYNVYLPLSGALKFRLPYQMHMLHSLRSQMLQLRSKPTWIPGCSHEAHGLRHKPIMILGDFNIAYDRRCIHWKRQIVDIRLLWGELFLTGKDARSTTLRLAQTGDILDDGMTHKVDPELSYNCSGDPTDETHTGGVYLSDNINSQESSEEIANATDESMENSMANNLGHSFPTQEYEPQCTYDLISAEGVLYRVVCDRNTCINIYDNLRDFLLQSAAKSKEEKFALLCRPWGLRKRPISLFKSKSSTAPHISSTTSSPISQSNSAFHISESSLSPRHKCTEQRETPNSAEIKDSTNMSSQSPPNSYSNGSLPSAGACGIFIPPAFHNWDDMEALVQLKRKRLKSVMDSRSLSEISKVGPLIEHILLHHYKPSLEHKAFRIETHEIHDLASEKSGMCECGVEDYWTVEASAINSRKNLSLQPRPAFRPVLHRAGNILRGKKRDTVGEAFLDWCLGRYEIPDDQTDYRHLSFKEEYGKEGLTFSYFYRGDCMGGGGWLAKYDGTLSLENLQMLLEFFQCSLSEKTMIQMGEAVGSSPSPQSTIRWMLSLMYTDGMQEVFQALSPNSRDRFTCWQQYTNQRYTNEGSTIDYILVDECLFEGMSGRVPYTSDEMKEEKRKLALPFRKCEECGTDFATRNLVPHCGNHNGAYTSIRLATCDGSWKPAAKSSDGLDRDTFHRHIYDTQFNECKTRSQGIIPSLNIVYSPPSYSDHVGLSLTLRTPPSTVLFKASFSAPHNLQPVEVRDKKIPYWTILKGNTRCAQPHAHTPTLHRFWRQDREACLGAMEYERVSQEISLRDVVDEGKDENVSSSPETPFATLLQLSARRNWTENDSRDRARESPIQVEYSPMDWRSRSLPPRGLCELNAVDQKGEHNNVTNWISELGNTGNGKVSAVSTDDEDALNNLSAGRKFGRRKQGGLATKRLRSSGAKGKHHSPSVAKQSKLLDFFKRTKKL